MGVDWGYNPGIMLLDGDEQSTRSLRGEDKTMIIKISHEAIKSATFAELQQARPRFNAFWRGIIDAEIAARQASQPLAPVRSEGTRSGDNWVPDSGPSPFRTRPGTAARFDEEDEVIHGVN
jgi:hypothetical protein